MQNATPHPYWKMNGLGNEIVVLDLRAGGKMITGSQAQTLATMPATAFDQMMVLSQPTASGTDALVTIFNADGSRAGACGNGMRCVGRLARELSGKSRFLFEVDDQLLTVDAGDLEQIAVDMGRPRFKWNEIPLAEQFHDTRYIELQIGPIDAPILHSPSVVNVGNPHAIFWVENVAAIDLARVGPMLENHPIFPDRANITIAQVIDRSRIRIRTWERGAGLTRACGSAACATAVCGARNGRCDRHVTIELPGGELAINWGENDHILMSGPAVHELRGHVILADGKAPVLTD